MFVNTISVTGNLGADPELNYLQDGKAVGKMRVAVWTGKGKDSMWLGITAWETLAERCAESLHKGQEVYVTGRLAVRNYTGKDGNERTAVEIIASGIQPTQRPERGEPRKEYVGATSRASRTADDFDKDDYTLGAEPHPF